MNQDDVKKLLLEIEDTELDFSVVFTGKKSAKVNGLYKTDCHEILLHNKNFSHDGELMYTAIHEYTHHKMCEEQGDLYSSRVHSPKFWGKFHVLLEKAEQAGVYKIDLASSPELLKITDEIKNTLFLENGKLVKRIGELLLQAHPLCKQAGIRYEDYVDRVLCLPRAASTALEKIKAYDLNPALGYEAMKQVSKIGSSENRKKAEDLFLDNKSSPYVQDFLRKTKTAPETDKRLMLEREKSRIEKTIQSLEHRLQMISSQLENLEADF